MVRVIVAAFILAFGVNSPQHVTEDEYNMINEVLHNRSFDRYQAWINACLYTRYTCSGVQIPAVTYEKMEDDHLGYYDGGDTVFINSRLRGILRKEVLMHEFIHYLQTKVGGLEVPGAAAPICAAEEEAFTIVDQWLVDIGQTYYVIGPLWWVAYPHCWRFYDPKWTSYQRWEQDIWELDY